MNEMIRIAFAVLILVLMGLVAAAVMCGFVIALGTLARIMAFITTIPT